MLSVTHSAATFGADGYEVIIECSARRSLPSFEIVGLPDAAIRESEKRIFTGSENSGFPIPSAEISINLAPADKRKEGTAIELAVLAAIYKSCGFINCDTDKMSFIGEISFSGCLVVPTFLPLCLMDTGLSISRSWWNRTRPLL